jgi:hypothetical protein
VLEAVLMLVTSGGCGLLFLLLLLEEASLGLGKVQTKFFVTFLGE